jgi:FAD:protein FMN transferase
MGSLAEVVLIGDNERDFAAAAEAALDEIERLSDRWSRFSAASEIFRINRAAARDWVLVDRELFAVLAECDRWRRVTAGAFDISAGSWRAGDVRRISGADIELDASRCAVRFRVAGLRLDLGAYGKGAALDLAGALLRELQFDNWLLQIGTSSVLARGDGLSGDGWRVQLRHPDHPEAIVRETSLQNRALSCSAALASGTIESDVINPLTGDPLTVQRACCVFAKTAAAAEAFSTACVVTGRDDALLAADPDGRDSATVVWL